MKANDFERMIALTVAGNYAIKNRNKDDYHLGRSAIKALCDTYDGMITDLEKAKIEVIPGLEKICFDQIQNNHEANKLKELQKLNITLSTFHHKKCYHHIPLQSPSYPKRKL